MWLPSHAEMHGGVEIGQSPAQLEDPPPMLQVKSTIIATTNSTTAHPMPAALEPPAVWTLPAMTEPSSWVCVASATIRHGSA